MTATELHPWQYRITREDHPGARPVGLGWLQTGPGLDEVVLEASCGTVLGRLIGFPIDLAGQGGCLKSGTHRLQTPLLEDVDAQARAIFRELGGRCLLILARDGVWPRVYADCSSQIPCVYDETTGEVAATAFSLLDETAYEARYDAALCKRLGVGHKGWVPGGLTAHEGVGRVLPNHCFDMGTKQASRYWPTGPIGVSDDPEGDVTKLIATIRHQIKALLAQGTPEVALALSAGRETRMLLGCAKPYLDQIQFVTLRNGNTDIVMSQKIAKDQSLRHRFLSLAHATDEERALYIRRNGDCVSDGNADMHPSMRPIADSHVFVGGLGGEVGRGFYWLDGEDQSIPMTGARLMTRFGLPPEERVIAALDAWLADVPVTDYLEILDLAYLEHRMGPWSAVMFPSDPTLRRLAPMLNMGSVEDLLRLPPEWKRNNGLARETVRQTWPELAQYPYNSLGKLRDTWDKVVRVMQDPSAIMRQLRKRRR